MVIFQILAVYFHSLKDLSSASTFYDKAIHQCSAMGDWQLLIIPSTKGETRETINEVKLQKNSGIWLRQPLKCEIAFLLHEATKAFVDANTRQCIHNRDPHGCMETPYNLSGKDSLQNYIHFLSSIHCSQRALILRK